jgi:hypothetical protein
LIWELAPDLTNEQVMELICSNTGRADGNWDDETGYGTIDAGKTLEAALLFAAGPPLQSVGPPPEPDPEPEPEPEPPAKRPVIEPAAPPPKQETTPPPAAAQPPAANPTTQPASTQRTVQETTNRPAPAETTLPAPSSAPAAQPQTQTPPATRPAVPPPTTPKTAQIPAAAPEAALLTQAEPAAPAPGLRSIAAAAGFTAAGLYREPEPEAAMDPEPEPSGIILEDSDDLTGNITFAANPPTGGFGWLYVVCFAAMISGGSAFRYMKNTKKTR